MKKYVGQDGQSRELCPSFFHVGRNRNGNAGENQSGQEEYPSGKSAKAPVAIS